MRPLASLLRRSRTLALILAISVLAGVLAAKVNSAGTLSLGAASATVMIDYPEPSIVDRLALDQDVSTLQKRADLYGVMMTTQPALNAIAKRMGISPEDISGVSRITSEVPIPLTQPDSEVRASQIVASRKDYRLELQSDPSQPLLSIYTAAPSGEAARKLADNAILGLGDYLRQLAVQQQFPQTELPQLRPLGAARGGDVGGKAKMLIAVLTFIVITALTAALLLGMLQMVRRRRGGPQPPEPAPRRRLDDWPHTNRALPWTLAVFMSILWLTPFDRIQLSFHTPIDMKLDRLLLPFVFVVWALAFAAGKEARPRFRLTGIHVAVGAFVSMAFLSVVIDARYLNHLSELELSLKKLPLLVSYVSVFFFMSTSIRPTEVKAFMRLTMWLGVIVGLGIIWEFRFNTNVFSLFASKVLHGPLQIAADSSPVVDSLGRRGIVGPTAVGLEAVTVLSLAFPVVIVGLLSAGTPKQRLLYGLAACILIAAAFATGRKSALLAPIAVIVTMAYFRRRELLSLAPIGLVIAVAVSVLSPGAVHGAISQFTAPDRASVATTSDRTADYDAVRPDVWTHLLFGRGYGSYDHNTYRILDSEILSRTIDMGVFGLIAVLMLGVAVWLCARKTIAKRDSQYAPLALIGAAAASCFLTVCTLYDVTGFPHATYIFLMMAGLTSVVVGREDPPARPPRRRRQAPRRRRPAAKGASPRRRDALV